MTRALYSVLETRIAWRDLLAVPNEAKDELLFLAECPQKHNSQPIWYGGYTVEHSMHIESYVNSHIGFDPDYEKRNPLLTRLPMSGWLTLLSSSCKKATTSSFVFV